MILLAAILLPVLVDAAVASYDGHIVTLSEVRTYSLLHDLSAREDEGGTDQAERAIKALILRRLKLQEIKSMGEVPPDAEELERLQGEVLTELAIPPEEEEEIRELVRENLLIRSYVERRFSPQVFVSEAEVRGVLEETFGKGVALPREARVKQEITTLLKLKKLNQLLKEWEQDLLEGVELRYLDLDAVGLILTEGAGATTPAPPPDRSPAGEPALSD